MFYDKKVNCVRNWYYKKDKQEHSKENARGRNQTRKYQLPNIEAKSEELAKKRGCNDFKVTDSWLWRWKARHNIKFKKAHGDKGGAQQWKTKKTGLHYRATPDGSLCYKHIALSGYKKAMDLITVLCCANMSGTDERKLLIIGKSDRPRCFKGQE
ncbi:hypothetical protein RF11_06138 [Thelohanellus kitauei]|uniref:HTH CENPB-type domain-containing protein n=1 Tax=Thelohanellus kitauei TaxID=669202 RepID=A0A0C2MCR5_THEKT|nr:hypothetical protein RF11_06138 [Thelohanellus kitauei]